MNFNFNLKLFLVWCSLCYLVRSEKVRKQGISCYIGWGQRGLGYSNELLWPRTCPHSMYCFEAVTTNMKLVDQLIDYPWDDYYDQYFIRGCGGSFGTANDIHPYRGNPTNFRTTLGLVKINVTTPHEVTGKGGTALMDLKYICRRNFCSGE